MGCRRTAATVAGDREAAALAASLGGVVRSARRSDDLTLEQLGRHVGLSRSRLAEVERGHGGTLPLEAWVRLGIVLARPLAVSFTGPLSDRLVDAGHLELQEWTLRFGRGRGWTGALEVATRPANPRHSADVLFRVRDLLLLIECWNTLTDFGAAVRSTQRKLAEAEDLAVAVGAVGVHGCWLVRPTAANRSLVRRFPEAVRSRFPESLRWERVFEQNAALPERLGFVWLDPAVGVTALRLRT
jgi:transcriptional regulator with XRE-family HTH domain